MYLPRGIGRLEKIGKKMIIEKNTEIYEPGGVPDHFYVVRSGSVIAYEYTYSGDRRVYNIIKPTVAVTDTEGNIISRSYYTVTYLDNVAPGKAKAVITFKTRYEGEKTLTFRIRKKR